MECATVGICNIFCPNPNSQAEFNKHNTWAGFWELKKGDTTHTQTDIHTGVSKESGSEIKNENWNIHSPGIYIYWRTRKKKENDLTAVLHCITEPEIFTGTVGHKDEIWLKYFTLKTVEFKITLTDNFGNTLH